jgi:hypothetical protein
MGDQHVSLVSDGVDPVDHDVLTCQRTHADFNKGAHLSLLVDVTFSEPIAHHFRVKVVQHSLDLSDSTRSLCIDLIQPIVGYQVQELGVEIIKALVGTQSCPRECHKCTSRQGVFRRSLIVRRLIVVRDIVKDGVGSRSLMGGNDTRSRSAFTVERWKFFRARQARLVH